MGRLTMTSIDGVSANIDDRVLCIAAAPFVQAARVLLAEG